MIRKLALLAAGALTLGLLTTVTAGAVTPPPPTGMLSCGFAASAATFIPALPGAGQAPSLAGVPFKIKNAKTAACNNAGVQNGKAPITGAVVNLNAKTISHVNCATLTADGLKVATATLTVKLTNATTTVATIKPVNLKFTTNIDAGTVTGFQITGIIPQTPANNRPFGGEHFTATIGVGNGDDLAACSAPGSTKVLTQIKFGAPSSGFIIG